jgi:hypothetical protein
MAIFSNVNIGNAPNDGTGDSLRTSFNKINENFQDILSIWPNISQNELTANITSTYISSFNLVEAETLSGNVLTADSGNLDIFNTNVNISDGSLSVSGSVTTIGNINSPFFNGNISGTNGTFSGNISTNTLNGNISGTTATFTGNINGTSSNLISINHVVRSPAGNNLGTAINGGSDTYEFILNTTDSVGSTVAYSINTGTNVTGSLNATITAGLERTYIVFNPGPSTSNLILPFHGNRTNIGTNVVSISGNSTAFIIVRTVNTDISNVFAQVANI